MASCSCLPAPLTCAGRAGSPSNRTDRAVNADQAFDVRTVQAAGCDAASRGLAQSPAPERASEATVSIDQVTLGGEALSDVSARRTCRRGAALVGAAREPGGSGWYERSAARPDALDGETACAAPIFAPVIRPAVPPGEYERKATTARSRLHRSERDRGQDAFASSAVPCWLAARYRWSDWPPISCSSDQIDSGRCRCGPSIWRRLGADRRRTAMSSSTGKAAPDGLRRSPQPG
jgi:hypothetical protein